MGPNIKGGLIAGPRIAGSTIESDSTIYSNIIKAKEILVRVPGDPNTTGRMVYALEGSSPQLIGRAVYPGTFQPDRICSDSSQILVYGLVGAQRSQDDSSSHIEMWLDYSTNDGASWVNIDSGYGTHDYDCVNDETGLGATFTLSGILSGSIVPVSGTIKFRYTIRSGLNQYPSKIIVILTNS